MLKTGNCQISYAHGSDDVYLYRHSNQARCQLTSYVSFK